MAYASEVLGLPGGVASSLGGAYKALTAAGTTQATGTAVTASMSVVAGADGTAGVTLKAAQPGDEVWLFNNSASTLKVYPPSGAAIAVNGTGVGTADAAFSHLTYKSAIYKCLTSTQWLVNVSA